MFCSPTQSIQQRWIDERGRQGTYQGRINISVNQPTVTAKLRAITKAPNQARLTNSTTLRREVFVHQYDMALIALAHTTIENQQMVTAASISMVSVRVRVRRNNWRSRKQINTALTHLHNHPGSGEHTKHRAGFPSMHARRQSQSQQRGKNTRRLHTAATSHQKRKHIKCTKKLCTPLGFLNTS